MRPCCKDKDTPATTIQRRDGIASMTCMLMQLEHFKLVYTEEIILYILLYSFSLTIFTFYNSYNVTFEIGETDMFS